jgi:hypothetical protein
MEEMVPVKPSRVFKIEQVKIPARNPDDKLLFRIIQTKKILIIDNARKSARVVSIGTKMRTNPATGEVPDELDFLN